MASSVWDTVTLRYWHGGRFKEASTGQLIYAGGQGKTIGVVPDELCFWETMDMAKKCGDYSTVEAVFYLLPGMGLKDGLVKVEDDKSVIALCDIAKKQKSVDLYVLYQQAYPTFPHKSPSKSPSKTVTPSQPPETQLKNQKATKPQKLTPKRAPPPVTNIPPRTRSRSKEIDEVIIVDYATFVAECNPTSEPLSPTEQQQPPTPNNSPVLPLSTEKTPSLPRSIEAPTQPSSAISSKTIDSPLTLRELSGESSDDENYEPENIEGEAEDSGGQGRSQRELMTRAY
ncbi:hypothetical protein BVRB_5g116460 [Beta vulgaris subsp. vulgaris]|nr:hypothetical protein BVRB_5g116460 [Beta vulgaris subsp. vulgaris]